MISTPSSFSARAKSTTPRLSKTDSERALDLELAELGRGLQRRCGRCYSAPSGSRTRSSTSTSRGLSLVEADAAAGDQADRPGQQLVLCLVQDRQDLLLAPECREGRTASCKMIGPVSTPSSTKWTVTPPTFTP